MHPILHPIPHRRRLFNIRRLIAQSKMLEELINEPPVFGDDCVNDATTEEENSHIVYRFSEAVKAFELTISLKKTEVLYHLPRQAYVRLQVSI